MKIYAIVEHTPDYTNIETFETFERAKNRFDQVAPEFKSEDNTESTITFGELEVGGKMYFGRASEFEPGRIIEEIDPYYEEA